MRRPRDRRTITIAAVAIPPYATYSWAFSKVGATSLVVLGWIVIAVLIGIIVDAW